ncbi:MAG: hypothetical protein M5U34_33265 [Chloroflexi bacterium]|nr:hypothetical protein [Chloroflexota bacterium]
MQGTLPDRAPTAAPAVMAPTIKRCSTCCAKSAKSWRNTMPCRPMSSFSDRTLVEMAIFYPQSVRSFGRLYGVGAPSWRIMPLRSYPSSRRIVRKRGLRRR